MRAAALNNFVREMIGDKEHAVADSSAIYADRIGRLIESDYRAVVRRFLKPEDVLGLISAGRRIAWPLLNRKRLEEGPIRGWSRNSARRGITLVVGEQEPSGSLLGFYLPEAKGLERPLIWIDGTVKRRAILAAPFIHETGHHIARLALGNSARKQRSCADRYERLESRDEVAADLFVSVAAIPHAMAVTMFRNGDGVAGLRRGYRKMCERYEIPLNPRRRDDEDLTCLIGSLHYMKLREALLSEFGV